MEYSSINPFNGEVIGKHQAHTEKEIAALLNHSQKAFDTWRRVSIEDRAMYMLKVAKVLEKGSERYAKMISLEMGKPITEARAEIQKCEWVCKYYAEKARGFLAHKIIETDAQLSFVRHDPIGGVLAIMPWNFPFWQVFRFAVPTLVAGNTAILKHASNVLGSGQLIEEIFLEAGIAKGVFQHVIVNHEKIENIISHPFIKAISLTGSSRAGAAVAAIAGKHIKRTLLELGGNNAFIVWGDAVIDDAVGLALNARMLNAGQSCIAAKRFILVEEIYDEFVSKFVEGLKQMEFGDPLKENTQIGPLARLDLANQLSLQVSKSIDDGAVLVYGGEQKECFYEPTVIGDVKPGMPVFEEETFGPVAAMIKAKSITHAFELAEQSSYGLGVTVCTTSIDKALSMASEINDGAYFINEMVKSDPRLPFGGEKRSGFGRELGKEGIMAFVNKKTVYLK